MSEEIKTSNFIEEFIVEDIAEGGQFEGKTVHTRFPPEPNGYLHIGHCKALIIDFGTAEKYNGLCNLRMDDTNPTKEDVEFVEAIKEDIHWLGFDWGDRFFYGSDYFDKCYEFAVELIKKGKAYVSDLTAEQIKEYRGSFTEPGKEDPYSTRSVEAGTALKMQIKASVIKINASDNCDFPIGAKCFSVNKTGRIFIYFHAAVDKLLVITVSHCACIPVVDRKRADNFHINSAQCCICERYYHFVV
mgnify:CR=1 FL=1